jgi:hypothetical protein
MMNIVNYSLGERFLLEQNVLPVKLRFKSVTVIQLIKMITDGTQSVYKNNRDFFFFIYR